MKSKITVLIWVSLFGNLFLGALMTAAADSLLVVSPQEAFASPRPTPTPTPIGDKKWICVTDDFSDRNVFAGYGPIKFTAHSKVRQACQATGSMTCSSTIECAKQETNPKAWYCELRNYTTGSYFGGEGASKLEAVYLARKDCYNGSSESTYACERSTSANCARQ